MHNSREVVVLDKEWDIFCSLLRKYVQAGSSWAAHDALDGFMEAARAVGGVRMSDQIYRLHPNIDARLIRQLREAGIETIQDLAEISDAALLARMPGVKYDAIQAVKRMAEEMAEALLDRSHAG